ncbi:CBS domain containing-hemolysin-like protein [Actimicrobium sp. GrIS 1.19]|uniref:hemolysin family protein n=1 Tax=Actimicrobium sp. GrIS 1.19 TaxID=3071708 RepID=UPI002E065E6F|nr:CBS domain containing-hemolysin-like protein [Actimicrobium sp. GrIS 1.19]
MHDFLMVFLALLLVVLNGFFVAAEFGLVKLRQTRIRAIVKTQGLRGRILGIVHAQLDAYLSACQLGITLASLALGWVGEPAFAGLLHPLFVALGITSENFIHLVSFGFAFLTISFLHIVVGELAPKSLAIRNPEIIGLWCALPLYGFYWSMYPVIWVLNQSANGVLRLFGLSGGHGQDAQYSADELKLILRSSRPGEKFNRDEWNVLAQTLDFSELDVGDLMRPAHEMASLSAGQSLQENLAVVYRSRYSRYPYFDAEGRELLGVIHLKDLFLAQQAGLPIDNLQQYFRPALTISPRMPALELFRRFRKGAPHFAVVRQEGQKPVGFVTLDNLLGAMVGEIRDEFRQNDQDWARQDDGTLLGKGSLPIFTLERILGIDIENEELDLDDIDSVGGLIMAKLGDIPSEGQRIDFAQFHVVVKKMNGPRIVMVKVTPKAVDVDDFGLSG